MPHDPVAVSLRQIREGEFDDRLSELADALEARRHQRDADWRQEHWYGAEPGRAAGLIGGIDTNHDDRGNPL